MEVDETPMDDGGGSQVHARSPCYEARSKHGDGAALVQRADLKSMMVLTLRFLT